MGRKKETRLQRNKHVRMNIGLMALQGTDLKPLRGKTVPLLVDPEAAAADLLERGVREMRMFNEDMKEGPFVLLYPDCSEVVHMPGSERPFNLAEYKKELGKPYSRITIYICLETHFKEGCVKADFGTSLDENEPEPPQIKEEEEEVCTSVREEQLELKQETETLMSTPTCEEGEDQTESAAETIVMVMVKEEPVSKVKLETNTVSPEQQHVCKEEQLLTDQEKNRDDPEPPEINEESDTDDSDYWSRYEPKRQKRLSYSNDKKSKNHLETNTELPQQHVCKEEEVLPDQEKNQEPPQIKEEQEEEQLKQETEIFIQTPTNEESDTDDSDYWSRYEPKGQKTRRKSHSDKSKIHLENNTELPQQHVYKEEVVLPDQEKNQDDPEPPQIKEEKEEVCAGLKEEELKQETETFHLTPTNEESDTDDSEDWSPDEPKQKRPNESKSNSDKSNVQLETNTESDAAFLTPTDEESDSDSDDWSPDEPKRQKRLNQSKSHGDDVRKSKKSKTQRETKTAKRYVCDTCGEDFEYLYQLNKHRLVHTGKKIYPCDSCDKTYYKPSALKEHQKIHMVEKLYHCNTCGKKFSQLPSLKKHTNVHADKKLYPCNMCDKGFSHMNTLREHMRIHTGEKPYACNLCEKRFKALRTLMVHMKVHSGERLYCCDICKKDFSHHSSLKKHMRLHTGEKPYSCNGCEETFGDLRALKRHKATHTGETS